MQRMDKPRARPRRTSDDIDAFVLTDAPGHLLRRCHQRSEELFTLAVGSDGPTRQQIAVLVTVCQHPEASQAELATRTGIDKNTLTQLIGRLIERGLIERRRAERDGRSNSITATPAALRMLGELMPRVRRVQDEILAPIPPELRPGFLYCLRLIGGLADTAAAPAPARKSPRRSAH
jgi:DNA-binding MarR family transcriptional regulator